MIKVFEIEIKNTNLKKKKKSLFDRYTIILKNCNEDKLVSFKTV